MKRILCLVMAVLMIAAAFSGCGKKQANGATNQEGTVVNPLYNPDLKLEDTGGLKLPLADTPVEIKWSIDTLVEGANDSFFAKKLREATGVNVQFIVFPPSSAGDKLNVLVASKQIPDIVGQGLEYQYAFDLCMQGAFASVQDYIDVLPNFKRTFVDTPENNWIFKSHAAPDGKLYGFFGWDWNNDISHGMLYRKDIFDKHGIEMWNSPEEFYQVLKKLKELYPNSTPFVSKNADTIYTKLGTSWGINPLSEYYDEATGKWGYSETSPKFKDMLDFLKKLYNEGLIDPEFLTCTQADWTSKMTQRDKAFVTFDWIGRLEMFKSQTLETVPEYDLRFANPIGPDQTYPTASQLCWSRHAANNDKAETSFKLLDFCLSPAGKSLVSNGIEGETFELDENGKAVMLGFEEGYKPSGSELEEKYGLRLQGVYLSFDRRSTYFQFTEKEQEAQDYAKVEGNMSPRDPELSFNDEEKQVKLDVIPELNKASMEFAYQYILNPSYGEKEWNDWLNKAKALGVEKLDKAYNDAQARFNEN